MAKIVSTSRSGAPATCKLCLAGKLHSFNWADAKVMWAEAKFNWADTKFYWVGAKPNAGAATQITSPPPGAFIMPQSLRYGTLYRCKICGQAWYLDGAEEMMSFVPEARMPLILKWSKQEILLSETILAKLNAIGHTPAHRGCWEYNETPCGVKTVSGECIDLSIVSLQRHAPFEPWRHCRLGSEIADIYESPYALPLPVRIAASQASEWRMGFAPTVVEVADGRRFTLNGRTDFWQRYDSKASEVRVLSEPVDWEGLGQGVPDPTNITYFIADL